MMARRPQDLPEFAEIAALARVAADLVRGVCQWRMLTLAINANRRTQANFEDSVVHLFSRDFSYAHTNISSIGL